MSVRWKQDLELKPSLKINNELESVFFSCLQVFLSNLLIALGEVRTFDLQ